MVQIFVLVKGYSSKMHTIGQRLAEERKRLGYNQTEFGALGEIGKGTVINWEKDLTSPTGTFLAEIAEKGADVLYILTGQRTEKVLNQRENVLINNYRHSNEKNKKVIEQVASATAKPEEIENSQEERKKA